jgi:hypothetical protein
MFIKSAWGKHFLNTGKVHKYLLKYAEIYCYIEVDKCRQTSSKIAIVLNFLPGTNTYSYAYSCRSVNDGEGKEFDGIVQRSKEGLPFDCVSALPIPKPIGGTLIFAVNSLFYVNQVS